MSTSSVANPKQQQMGLLKNDPTWAAQQSVSYSSFIRANSEKTIAIEATPKYAIYDINYIAKLNKNKEFPRYLE